MILAHLIATHHHSHYVFLPLLDLLIPSGKQRYMNENTRDIALPSVELSQVLATSLTSLSPRISHDN